MEKHVPHKLTSQRFNQTWVNSRIKRLSRKKKRAFKKAKTSNAKEDWDFFKKLKKEAQSECRLAYNSYVSSTLEEDYPSNPKKFWSFIKSKRQDQCGVAPLKKNDTLHSDAKTKAKY